MKNIIAKILVIAALFSSTTACSDDWLSLSDPNHETTDTFWKTAEQFDQGLSAAYSTWRRPGYFSRWFQILMILRGDEGWSESPNPEFQADANFIISAYNYDRNEGIVLPWQAMYNSLYYVNQVIDNMHRATTFFLRPKPIKFWGRGTLSEVSLFGLLQAYTVKVPFKPVRFQMDLLVIKKIYTNRL